MQEEKEREEEEKQDDDEPECQFTTKGLSEGFSQLNKLLSMSHLML